MINSDCTSIIKIITLTGQKNQQKKQAQLWLILHLKKRRRSPSSTTGSFFLMNDSNNTELNVGLALSHLMGVDAAGIRIPN